MPRTPRPWQERVREHFTEGDVAECWLWRGHAEPYGRVRLGGAGSRYTTAQRAVYELLVGPIPEGLHVDHLCRNQRCVNPSHLEPVTCGENLRRSPLTLNYQHGTKTHCVNGHEFTPENTRIRTNGGRTCKACHREKNRISERLRYAKRRAERRSL